MVIFYVAVGACLVLVLARLVVLLLDDLGENYDPWGADGDRPVDYALTPLGTAAAVSPSEFVLDEADETWGSAS